MLEDFTVETFSGRIGERFRITSDDTDPLDAELIEASEVADTRLPEGGRVPFSIVFRAPMEPPLPQRIYRFEHDALPEFELFIVPIGPDESGMRYEAVFG